MMRRWLASAAVLVFGLLISATPRPRERPSEADHHAASATNAQESPWLERTPYEIPFADRATWLAFMADGPEPDTAALAEAWPDDEFAGLVDGSLASVERVAFRSDSLVLRGLLVRPPGPGPFPAVVYARGGNREFGRLRFLDLMRMFAIARGGRVVLAPEYRGEGGSQGDPSLAAGDVDDVLASVRVLGQWADADTSRLGVVGFSRGGLVAAWALTRTPAFDAAILVAADLDLADTAARRPELDSAVYALSVAGYARDRAAALHAASPISAIDRMADTPLLLLHGADDRQVHPSTTLRFSGSALEAGRSHRLVLLDEGSHSLIGHALTVRQEIEAWLARHLATPLETTAPTSRGMHR